MELPAKLRSRKLWAFITGAVFTLAAWIVGDIAAKQAINDLVVLVLGYVGVQGYVDAQSVR